MKITSIPTKPSRYPSRGSDLLKVIYPIIDEALFCTIAFIRSGIPHQIPTGFFRKDDYIYIHASSKSNFFGHIIGQEVSFSMTHLDALVLAPTALDHSFNYRSVVGFATAEEVTDPEIKKQLFAKFTDRYVAGRINDVGMPTPDHVSITKMIKLSLHNAGAKVRSGGVNTKMNGSEPWSGIIPIHTVYGTPQIDTQLGERNIPEYISVLTEDARSKKKHKK